MNELSEFSSSSGKRRRLCYGGHGPKEVLCRTRPRLNHLSDGRSSVRSEEDITEALWGARVSPGRVSNLNKKIYAQIDA